MHLGQYTVFFVVWDRFEEPLANLLNERHRTVKELLEQLKMRKSSSKPQPEVEKLKPQPETVHQTLVLDPAQRSRLQQQMQQARLLSVSGNCVISSLPLTPKMSSVVKSGMAVLLPMQTSERQHVRDLVLTGKQVKTLIMPRFREFRVAELLIMRSNPSNWQY